MVPKMPATRGSPPTVVGAVVVAKFWKMAPIPPHSVRTATMAAITPTRIRQAFRVSVAATDSKPPMQVKISSTMKNRQAMA